MPRIAVFVDGFNLYHSLEDIGQARLKWLDLSALVRRFLKPDEMLSSITYFTALTSWDADKQLRHKRYIRALELSGAKIHYGKFKSRGQTCNQCGFKYKIREEKRTDVNIAVFMLVGAIQNEYDTAILISGDTDLIPAIHAVKELHPEKRVGLLFPWKRHTTEMEQAADFFEVIREVDLVACRLPETIRLPSGKYLTAPPEWV
jgi:uncharacterized LabA/DUF88 family protein